jgi:hypothetical protein
MCLRTTVAGSFVTGPNDLFPCPHVTRPGEKRRAVIAEVTGWAGARRASAVAV